MKHVRLHILLLVFIITISSEGFAQWKKIADFGQLIESVNFPIIHDTPRVGFVGVETYSPTEIRLYRTGDGGRTFTSINYPEDVGGGYTIPHRFSFKDSLHGWFSGVDGRSIFETLDGGMTWKIIYSGPISGLCFVPTTNLLICSHISKSYTSTSDGVIFNTVDRLDVSSTRSITFSDGMHGIISATDDINSILITSDGGVNWSPVDFHSEFYHPVGIEGTPRFYVMSEACRTNKNNILFRSNDGGLNWNQLFSYKQSDLYLTTGTVQYGIEENIFFQTTEEGNDGIMMSVDSGVSFSSICGPSTRGDTKFFVRDSFIYAGDKYGGLWLNTTAIGSNSKPILSKDTLRLTTTNCSSVIDTVKYTLFDSCNGRQATLLDVSISGSSQFDIVTGNFPRVIHPNDTLPVTYHTNTDGSITDTATIRLKYKLGWKEFDTIVTVIGKYQPPQSAFIPSISDTSLSLMSSTCYGKEQTIYYWLTDSCIGAKGELISATVTGSTNFQVTADADSATVIYSGAGYDTAKLALKFRLYEYEYDTVITLYGYPSATKDSLSFLATLTKPLVTWEETTELRVSTDKAAANKNLSEIRFDVTLDADVLEPLTNYSTGIAGAAIMMGNPTPIGKLMRFPFTIIGNNMTLDPAVIILNMPMRPYVSDTTMTTIEVSTIRLNPQDADYERCTLSATGNGTPFSLELMCGDSTLSRYLGGKPILTITSLKPNPTKADVTVTFDLATSGAVQAEVLDVLGNVVKEETFEATQGETKYNISLPDAAEGVYYVRLRYGAETRTGKFVRE